MATPGRTDTDMDGEPPETGTPGGRGAPGDNRNAGLH